MRLVFAVAYLGMAGAYVLAREPVLAIVNAVIACAWAWLAGVYWERGGQ